MPKKVTEKRQKMRFWGNFHAFRAFSTPYARIYAPIRPANDGAKCRACTVGRSAKKISAERRQTSRKRVFGRM